MAGVRIETPEQVDAALDFAFRADRPVVIDALADANALISNARTAAQYASRLALSIAKGNTVAASHLGDAIKAAQ